jgi:adenosylcobinamide kinase/adenosylcobinamide-phosphate guanylyltransferase
MRVTLVIGGARSGKSRYAESLLAAQPKVTYVAPGAVPDGSDPEWAQRIWLHQARRPSQWTTVETTDLATVILAAEHPVLIDCLSTWITRLVDDIDGWAGDDRTARTASHLEAETTRLLDALRSATVEVVLVTSEVGFSIVPETASGRRFRDDLGRLNAAVSAASQRVVLVVAGRVLDLSGCPVVVD